MEMEVVGRHALLFDDDAMAAFVNSSDALVEWNSIPIDRYDVRHLLSSPPPPRRRNYHHFVDSLETELDLERYVDLSYHLHEEEEDLKPVDTGGGYNAVAFSYGNNEEESAAHKDSDSGLGSSAFCPPFPVPVDLVIPPTEKLHQIIARTAIYVSRHGAQSEIVLRVKQGENPTFGFLMPDHHLHSYFRYLVDHSEVLHSGEKPQNDMISDTEPGVGGGALSLLGSLYGFGDDDDAAVECALTSEEKASDGAITTRMSEKTASSKSISIDAVSNHPVNSQDKVPAKPKDKVFMLKRNSFTSGLKAGSGSDTRKEGESVVSHSATTSRSQSSSMAPTSMVEPPSEMKKMIAKIVEFIMKNGKQFEAVLIEQDSEHGRFPFLLPSSQYYQYYLKVLEEAQKSRVSGRASVNEKDGLGLHGSSKKTIVSKGSGSSLESAEFEIPFDSDRKEKFKMVIGKSKNDGLDPPSKASQQQSEVGVDAAAILQAATKGIRTPNLDFLSRSSLNRKDNNIEHVSSLGSSRTSQPLSVAQKSDQNGARALEAAGEADSLEANLTREQKLKAERLRRAKMFVAMIKSGSAPQIKPESSRGISLEPCNFSGVDAEDDRAAREREGSSAPLEIDATENIESAANKFSTDEYNERKARRKYRSNSSKYEAAKDYTNDEEDEVEDEVVYKYSRNKHSKEEKGVDEIEIKQPRKQHTHRASDYVSEQDHSEKYHRYSRKHHRSRKASHDGDEKDEVEHDDERDHKYSRKHHRSYKSSDDEDEEVHEDRRSRKKHRSRRSSHDGDEKDEVEHDDERDHKYSRKHHRSYKSSNDEDEDEHEDRRSRKKHRSHHHSRHRSRDSHGHKHRRRHTSSKDRESRRRDRHNITSEEEIVLCVGSDELNGKVPRSEREDLEEGEISAKVSDQSRGSAGGARREPSVDVSSSFQDQRSSSQPLEPTEVSSDLRAKIRAMLLETL